MLGPMGLVPAAGIEGTISASVKQLGKVSPVLLPLFCVLVPYNPNSQLPLTMPSCCLCSIALGGRPGVAREPSDKARALRPGRLAVPGGGQADRRHSAAAWSVQEGGRGQDFGGVDLRVHVFVLPSYHRLGGRQSRGCVEGGSDSINNGCGFFLLRGVVASGSGHE